MANDGKLYVNGSCSVCMGKKRMSCHYCDINGLHFIEASDRIITEVINTFDAERIKKIKEQLRDS